jgi:hypothetical protein
LGFATGDALWPCAPQPGMIERRAAHASPIAETAA